MSDADAAAAEGADGDTEATPTAPDAGLPEGVAAARERLAAVRADPDRRRTAHAAGAVVGLVLATLHPVGLVVGGALVALPAADLARGVAAGAAFGVLALAAFAAVLALGGGLGGYATMGTVTVVSVVVAVVLPVVGSLARGAV